MSLGVRPNHCRQKSGLFAPDFTQFIAMLIIALISHSSAAGQLFAPNRPAAADDQGEKPRELPTDRRVTQQLESLTEAGKKKDIDGVRETLELIRGADPMLMVADARGTFIPLHRDLVQRLQAMDSEILTMIEATSGDMSFRISKGVTEGSESLVRELHKAAGTRPAWIAHLMLAKIHHDRGHALAAQYWLRPLLTPVVPNEIRIAAERLSEQIVASEESTAQSSPPSISDPASPVKERRPNDEDESEASTNEQGDKSKPEESSEGTHVAASDDSQQESRINETGAKNPDDDFGPKRAQPDSLHVHWMQRIPLPENERRVSHDLVKSARERSMVPWTAWEPLADDKMVFVRSPYLIKAFDRATGAHVWTRVIQRSPSMTDDMFPPGFRMPIDPDGNPRSEILRSAEVRILHRNEMVGRLTADTDRLFAVCQVVEGLSPDSAGLLQARMIQDSGPLGFAGLWELVAVEKSSGRRLWTVGGMPLEERFGNDFSGCWFAGPPCVSGDELYAVIERKQAMELAAMSAETGQSRWSATLSFPSNEINLDAARHGLAARITVNSGVIFATTTTGWFFAIDSLSHSVLWARKLPVATGQDDQQVRFQFRRAGQHVSAEPAFTDVWRTEAPIVAGKSIIVSSAECSQLLILESLTGRLLHRSSAGQSKLILYCDQSTIVTASGKAIQAYSIPDLKKIWTQSIEKSDSVPVGRAARQEDTLLVPVSTGDVEVRDFKTGAVLTIISGLRPPRSSGGFFNINSNGFASLSAADATMISFAPDHVALVSRSKPGLLPNHDPLERAQFLVDTGQFEAAQEALNLVHVHALTAESVRQLQFRIAIGELARLGENAGTEQLGKIETIVSLAKSPRELAIGHLLRIQSLIEKKSEGLIDEITNLLAGDESVLTVDIVKPDRLLDVLQNSSTDPLERSHSEPMVESLRMPFRSWLIEQVRQNLEQSGHEGRKLLVERLRGLSDDDLLQIHSPRLIDEYLFRVDKDLDNKQLKESTIHLIKAVVVLSLSSGDRRDTSLQQASERLARLRQYVVNDANRDVAQSRVIQRLVDVLHYELIAGKLAEDPPKPQEMTTAVQQRWSSFQDQAYAVHPIQTNGMQSYRPINVRRVNTSASHDSFLSAFEWSIRRDPGALIARSVANPDAPIWSLSTTASENQPIFSDEEIHRVGSVIIVQNSAGVAAFSTIDHRWLWAKPFPGNSSSRMSFLDRQAFTDFRTRINLRSVGPIAGASYRWICLRSAAAVEVIDLMNGRRLWSIGTPSDSERQVIASEGYVSINSDRYRSGNENLILNPLNGDIQDSEEWSESEFEEKFVATTPEAFVLAESSYIGRGRSSLKWIRPSTRDVIRSIELSEMKAGLFLDANTLVIVTDDDSFQVINLQNGSQETFSYASRKEDVDAFEPTSVRVSSDGTNYYVFESSDDAPIRMLGMSYGMETEPIGEQLRVVSRVSREVIWEGEFEEDTLACIRSGLSPVLLLIRNKTEGLPNNRILLPGLGNNGQQWNIRGISRMTGKPLFEYNASIRSVNTHLHLDLLEGGTLDLLAFGNRIRFRPQPVAAP